ncbi:MAG: filamentous hemagglutinin N-terminal domain-containing protein [Myxococcota bacterium]
MRDTRTRRDASIRAAALAALVGALAAAVPSAAQVVRDGSLGARGFGAVDQVAGPGGGIDYLIRESDGERVGGRNLFHSFDRFDLSSSERAIYQGDGSIENLITRVTGGASTLDGTIRSEIPGANLFFLNPAGILFGENAQIDVSGAFIASTADRALFTDGGVFETAAGAAPSLSIADVAGFGFLSAPAPIRIVGSQIEHGLDRRFGLIGGDLELRGGRSDGQPGTLAVRSGELDLASLASSGEVYIDADVDGDGIGDGALRIENASRRGDVTIADDFSVSTSGIESNPFGALFRPPGEGSGQIEIAARNLTIDDADLRTLTVTDEDAGDLSIDLTGDFVARARPGGRQSGIIAGTGLSIDPEPGQVVTNVLFASYATTDVTILVCGASLCGVRYDADGDAGDVAIRARNVRLEGGARITARSDGRGDAGTIRLAVDDSIVFRGLDAFDERSGLSSTAESTGAPGAIEIDSPGARLVLDDSGTIVIQNSAASLAGGAPGRIEIDVARLELSGEARIDSSTRGAGPGGRIGIVARDSVRLEGRSDDQEFSGITTLSQPGSTGPAGDIRIETPRLVLVDGAEISARPVGPTALGDAGNLELVIADRLRLRDATISTESASAAGGNIALRFGGVVDLEGSTISTSVTSGPESGGNVTIEGEAGSAVVLDGSRVVAQADAGAGGNIVIESDLFLPDPASLVSASSNRGIDGRVVSRAPDRDAVDFVEPAVTPVVDASALLAEPCAAKRPDALSSLVVASRGGLPITAAGWLPAPLPDRVRAKIEGEAGGPEAADGSSALASARARVEAGLGRWARGAACGG